MRPTRDTINDLALAGQVHLLAWMRDASRWLAERTERDDRGDVYSHTIMIALAVVIAITVGGILLYKFQTKAEGIDTNTPTGALPAP